MLAVACEPKGALEAIAPPPSSQRPPAPLFGIAFNECCHPC